MATLVSFVARSVVKPPNPQTPRRGVPLETYFAGCRQGVGHSVTAAIKIIEIWIKPCIIHGNGCPTCRKILIALPWYRYAVAVLYIGY